MVLFCSGGLHLVCSRKMGSTIRAAFILLCLFLLWFEYYVGDNGSLGVMYSALLKLTLTANFLLIPIFYFYCYFQQVLDNHIILQRH